jgi:hypothetical protein
MWVFIDITLNLGFSVSTEWVNRKMVHEMVYVEKAFESGKE